ncbi:MAG: enolase C-terminal domain-like protein [Solirubrobacterales bacterium]
MKIEDVRLFSVEGDGPAWVFDDRSVESLDRYPDHVRPTAGAGDLPTKIVHRYVEIAVAGEVGLYGPIDIRQAFLIATDLRAHLLGADPFAIEGIHDRLLRVHRHGRAGLFVNAISSVNNALWDLLGRIRGEPVYRLLGGPTRDRIPAYASMLGYSVEPERAAEAAAEHARLGYDAQKWFFAHGPGAGWQGLQRNLAMARAVREAVGSGYPLMFDAFMGWDLPYATDMLRGLEDVQPFWMEEPVPPEQLSVFRRLAASSNIRLATGEHTHLRWQVKELLDNGVGLIQSDPDWDGGISEHLHICSLCSAYDVPVVAHGCAIPVPVHLAAARSPQTIPMVEYLVKIQERAQWFHLKGLHPVDGSIAVPTDPGLGIEIDPAKVLGREELFAES